jgi:hypothetical protein
VTKKTDWARGFDAGYACAVANILRLHNEPVIARDVLGANVPSQDYDLEPADLEVLEGAGLLPWKGKDGA